MFKKIKLLCLFLLLLAVHSVRAQIAEQVWLIANWQDTSNCPALPGGQHWNDVWGFVAHGREYAVLGGTSGAHIIDVAAVKEVAFLPGKATGVVHRDYKTFRNYLYAVADEGIEALQVYDFSYLPDSIHLVYQSDPRVVSNAHSLFIDTATAKLYLAAPTALGFGKQKLQIFSLSDPENPSLLYTSNDFEYSHHLYARNDTAWCSNGFGGYLVLDVSQLPQIKILGGLSFYPYQGYNHSSWVGYDNIGVMTDENFGAPVKVVDCRNMQEIKVLSTFSPNGLDSTSVPHNPFLLGKYALVSYYQDGLQIYDISNPALPKRTGYYDSYPGPSKKQFAGAWGCYPYLPSGKVLVSDMQRGLFILDISAATPSLKLPKEPTKLDFELLPNPVTDRFFLRLPVPITSKVELSLIDLFGRVIFTTMYSPPSPQNTLLEVSLPANICPGTYQILFKQNGKMMSSRLTKQ